MCIYKAIVCDCTGRIKYKQSTKIPLNFVLSGSISHDSYICAMAIYTTPAKIREVVRACPKHKADIKALRKYKAEEVGHT